jgi:hypothetical protein
VTNLERICREAPGTTADDVKCLMLMREVVRLPYRVADAAKGQVPEPACLRESAAAWIANGRFTAIEIIRDSDTDNWGRFLAADYTTGETE